MAEMSWLEIDLGRIQANAQALRRLMVQPGPGGGPGRICAVVKKNAYGMGAVRIAHRLVKAGCEMLAVYEPAEATELVAGGVTAPILLFMPLRKLNRTDLLYRHAVAERLHLAIHERRQLEQVNEIGHTFGIRMPVHLYLDTGMSRAGLHRGELEAIVNELANFRHVRLAGLYSHLATADDNADFAYEQLDRFHQSLAGMNDRLAQMPTLHIANTFAVLRDPAFHLDMIRPGLGLFGYGPQMMVGPIAGAPAVVQPVMRWMSRVILLQHYQRWSPVGYGSTHRLRRDSVLGIVPVGYGDGYPLALSDQATVRLHLPEGPVADAAVIGRVNMDQIVIDLTDVAGENARRLMDCPVEVISDDPDAPNALPRLAEMAQTHCYEMLCGLSARLVRKYVTR